MFLYFGPEFDFEGGVFWAAFLDNGGVLHGGGEGGRYIYGGDVHRKGRGLALSREELGEFCAHISGDVGAGVVDGELGGVGEMGEVEGGEGEADGSCAYQGDPRFRVLSWRIFSRCS